MYFLYFFQSTKFNARCFLNNKVYAITFRSRNSTGGYPAIRMIRKWIDRFGLRITCRTQRCGAGYYGEQQHQWRADLVHDVVVGQEGLTARPSRGVVQLTKQQRQYKRDCLCRKLLNENKPKRLVYFENEVILVYLIRIVGVFM